MKDIHTSNETGSTGDSAAFQLEPERSVSAAGAAIGDTGLGQALRTYRVNLQELATGDSFNRTAFLALVNTQSERICSLVHRLSAFDPTQNMVMELFTRLKEQILSSGYVRMVDALELREAMTDGYLQRGRDFALKGKGARMGHNGRFVALVCTADSTVSFGAGARGSSEVNIDPIPLRDLDVFIPQLTEESLDAIVNIHDGHFRAMA